MLNKLAVRIAVLEILVLLVVMIGGGTYLVMQQSAGLEAQLLERARIESIVGAQIYGRFLEEAVDNGALTVEDVFDQDYRPMPGFDPPKYRTRYDVYCDKAMMAWQDEFLKDESLLYAAGVDTKGYVPTHNSRFNKPITGNAEADKAGNRTKRIFNDKVGIRVATNIEPGFLQEYQRDVGGRTWDVSSPIYVKGKHWGGFRVGVSLEKMNQAKLALQLKVAAVLGAILLLSSLFVYFTVSAAMRPLTRLTRAASDLADGRIGEKIVVQRKDEIGQMADVMERLRLSLKAAIERLQRKP